MSDQYLSEGNINQLKSNSKVHAVTICENNNDFCLNTSLHGLKYVGNVNLNYVERTFFLISFFVALAGAFYFISNVYAKWVSTPVIIGIDAAPTFINQIPFSAITICNMNSVLANKVKNIPNTTVEYSLMQTLCAADEDDRRGILNISNDWNSFYKFIEQATQPCADMIKSCRLGQHFVDCKNLFRRILTDEGACCSFNVVDTQFLYKNKSNTGIFIGSFNPRDRVPVKWDPEFGFQDNLPPQFYPTIVSGTGSRLGLSLILNVSADNYYCSSTNSIGFKALLHNPIETPKLADFAFTIGVGRESRVVISPQKNDASEILRDIDQQYRQCTFSDEGNLSYYKTYSRTNCMKECEATYFYNECNCIEFHMPRIRPDIKLCSRQNIDCSERVHQRTETYTVDKNDCIEKCLAPCFELNYIPNVFTVPFAHGNFTLETDFPENLTNEYIDANIAVVHFYYTENAFRIFSKQQFIGFTEFVSNTGGLMGLFLGFSVLSLVELIYYGTLRPWYASRRYKQQEIDQIIIPSYNQNKFNTKIQNHQKNRPMQFRKSVGYGYNSTNPLKSVPIPYRE